MPITPLDMQVNLGQMDFVGKDYLRLYNAPRHDQHFHAADMERKAKDVDTKVLDLPEEFNEYQQINPDKQKKKRQKQDKEKEQLQKEQENNPYQEFNKGNLIDVKS